MRLIIFKRIQNNYSINSSVFNSQTFVFSAKMLWLFFSFLRPGVKQIFSRSDRISIVRHFWCLLIYCPLISPKIILRFLSKHDATPLPLKAGNRTQLKTLSAIQKKCPEIISCRKVHCGKTSSILP